MAKVQLEQDGGGQARVHGESQAQGFGEELGTTSRTRQAFSQRSLLLDGGSQGQNSDSPLLLLLWFPGLFWALRPLCRVFASVCNIRLLVLMGTCSLQYQMQPASIAGEHI